MANQQTPMSVESDPGTSDLRAGEPVVVSALPFQPTSCQKQQLPSQAWVRRPGSAIQKEKDIDIGEIRQGLLWEEA